MSLIGPKPDLQKSDSPVGFLLFNRLAWGADILLIARPAVLPGPCLSGDSIYPESTYVEGIRSGAHLEFCTMRKIVLAIAAVAAVAAFTGSAFAADMAARPYTKAPRRSQPCLGRAAGSVVVAVTASLVRTAIHATT